jgi:hypothetical protein
MKYRLILGTICILVALIKGLEVGPLHISDANNYYVLAQQVIQGQLLYRDVLVDNFPLFVYVSVIYSILTGGSLYLYNLIPIVESTGVAVLLYRISVTKWKNERTALLVSLTYLLSYTTLSSTLQLGYYTATLTLLASYACILHKKYRWAGVFAAAAVLMKAPFLFPVIGIMGEIYRKDRRGLFPFMISSFVFGIIVMLPTIMFAFPDFLNATFGFGLVRESMDNRLTVFAAFITRDILIAFLLVTNLFLFRKSTVLAAGTGLLLIFMVLYRDVFYVYLLFLVPLAALGSGYLLESGLPLVRIKPHVAFYATLLALTTIVTLANHLPQDWRTDRVPRHEQLLEQVRKNDPAYLYGLSVLTDGVSYLSGIPVYNRMYGTISLNYFATGNGNKQALVQDAIRQRSLIMVETIRNGPEVLYDTSVIDEAILTSKNCKQIYTHDLDPDPVSGNHKGIVLIRCY